MIVKEAKIIIDGKHTVILSNICDLASRYIRKNKKEIREKGIYTVDEYQPLEVRDIEAMIDRLWCD